MLLFDTPQKVFFCSRAFCIVLHNTGDCVTLSTRCKYVHFYLFCPVTVWRKATQHHHHTTFLEIKHIHWKVYVLLLLFFFTSFMSIIIWGFGYGYGCGICIVYNILIVILTICEQTIRCRLCHSLCKIQFTLLTQWSVDHELTTTQNGKNLKSFGSLLYLYTLMSVIPELVSSV